MSGSSSKARKKSSSRGKPKLFDYFVVLELKQTNFNTNTGASNVPLPPDASLADIGWEPSVTYLYNANRVSRTVPYTDHKLTDEEQAEETSIMMKIPKFCYCDLTHLVNTFNHTLSESDKEHKKYYKILNFKHALQSESFTFVLTKSHGSHIYGHCRRCFTNDRNKMPTALCLISNHGFHKLFEQIMDHCLTRWFVSPESIFPLLDALVLQSSPALGDTFTVTIASQINKISDERLTFKLESIYHQSLLALFRTLSVENILFLVSCILTERRLIFYSHSLQTLSECIHGLLAVIYPFQWQNIFVPILPESLLNYLCAPLPFIIGIKGYLAQCMTDEHFPMSEVIAINLDVDKARNSNIKCAEQLLNEDLKYLPTNPSWKLSRELKKILKKFSLYLEMPQRHYKAHIITHTHTHKKHGHGHKNKKKKRSMKIKKFLEPNLNAAIQGFNDIFIYDACLSFFVLFIGDWKNFCADASTNADANNNNASNNHNRNHNNNMPRPPFHLGSDTNALTTSGANNPNALESSLPKTATRIARNDSEVSVSVSTENSSAAHAAFPSERLSFATSASTAARSSVTLSQSASASQYQQQQSPVMQPQTQTQPRSFMKFAGKAFAGAKNFSMYAAENVKKKVKTTQKKRETRKQAQMFYDEEALAYIELLCQSQLFVSWFIRQQIEANDTHLKVHGVQDRFDYALQARDVNNGGFGASYTGCYKFLMKDTKYRYNMNRLSGNLKQTIDVISSFTSNRDYTQLMQNRASVEQHIAKLSIYGNRPLNFEVINNILSYRLKDTIGKDFAHGLMSMYLLVNLMEKSSDRFVIKCCNSYALYAHILRSCFEHENQSVEKQMKEIAGKLFEYSTRLESLKKLRIGKYVSFSDLYQYKYKKVIPASSAKNTPTVSKTQQKRSTSNTRNNTVTNRITTTNININISIDTSSSLFSAASTSSSSSAVPSSTTSTSMHASQSSFVPTPRTIVDNTADLEAKLGQIDFQNIASMDAKEQSKMLEILGVIRQRTGRRPIVVDNDRTQFLTNSQFSAVDENVYREKMMKGEVQLIPPFLHLHMEFEPDIEDIELYENDGGSTMNEENKMNNDDDGNNNSNKSFETEELFDFFTDFNGDNASNAASTQQNTTFKFPRLLSNTDFTENTNTQKPNYNKTAKSIFDMPSISLRESVAPNDADADADADADMDADEEDLEAEDNEDMVETFNVEDSFDKSADEDIENVFLTRSSTHREHKTVHELDTDWIKFDADNTPMVDSSMASAAKSNPSGGGQNTHDIGLNLFDSMFATKNNDNNNNNKQNKRYSKSSPKKKNSVGKFADRLRRKLSKTNITTTALSTNTNMNANQNNKNTNTNQNDITWETNFEQTPPADFHTFDANFLKKTASNSFLDALESANSTKQPVNEMTASALASASAKNNEMEMLSKPKNVFADFSFTSTGSMSRSVSSAPSLQRTTQITHKSQPAEDLFADLLDI